MTTAQALRSIGILGLHLLSFENLALPRVTNRDHLRDFMKMTVATVVEPRLLSGP